MGRELLMGSGAQAEIPRTEEVGMITQDHRPTTMAMRTAIAAGTAAEGDSAAEDADSATASGT